MKRYIPIFESDEIVNKLNESPDSLFLLIDDSNLIEGAFNDDDAIAFGQYGSEIHISQFGRTHRNCGVIVKKETINDDDYDENLYEFNPYTFLSRGDYKYSGRLWINKKIISFWEFPPVNELKSFLEKLLDALKLLFLFYTNENANKYTILSEYSEPELYYSFKNLFTNKFSDYVIETNETDENGIDVGIKLSDYIKSSNIAINRDENELNKDHIISPMLKSKINIPDNFGSKNKRSLKREAELMGVPIGQSIINVDDSEIENTQTNITQDIPQDKVQDITETDNFKKWFGNSKVVDENGKPLICYHGTNREFSEFKPSNIVGRSHDAGFYGDGYYFTFNTWKPKLSKGEASYYGKKVMEVYIKAENPFYFNTLSKYKGNETSLMFYEPMVFLRNIAELFPEISAGLTINKRGEYDREDDSYPIHKVSIDILPSLFEKYEKLIKIDQIYNSGKPSYKRAYVKEEIKSYKDEDGKTHEWIDTEHFGRYNNDTSEWEIRMMAIIDAIEKYEGIEADFMPEGYMTRHPEITEMIKSKGHDSIMQSSSGDEVVVFSPNQIKSATNNNGNFDINSNNINESIDVNYNQYQFLGMCDKLRITSNENEQKWNDMMKSKSPISDYEFIKNVNLVAVLDEGETPEQWILDNNKSDTESSAYKSNWGNIPCIFYQTMGFEFIFTKQPQPINESVDVNDNVIPNWESHVNDIPMLKEGVNILNRIEQIGKENGIENPEAYIVGGTVRDLLTGEKTPDDIDIATNVPVKLLEPHFITKDIGKNKTFGLIMAISGDFEYEIANYRKDVYSQEAMEKGMGADSIQNVDSYEEDSSRRDFTINSMGVDKNGVIVDYHGGLDDIKTKTLRAVGEPKQRFEEDATRLLRAIRFSNRLGFDIEENTLNEIKNSAPLIKRIVSERIMKEIRKLAKQPGSNFAKALNSLYDTGLLENIFPELSKMKGYAHNPEHHPEGGVWEHVMAAIAANNEPDPLINLAILFHDIGKPETYVYDDVKGHTYHGHPDVGAEIINAMSKRLDLSNDEKEAISFVAKKHMLVHNLDQLSKKKLISLINDPNWQLLKKVAKCDDMVRGDLYDSKEWDKIDAIQNEINEKFPPGFNEQVDIIKQIRQQYVNGSIVMDVLNLPKKPDPIIGDIQEIVADWIIETEIKDQDEINNKIIEAYEKLTGNKFVSQSVVINEERLKDFNLDRPDYESLIEVYKNPPSIKRMEPNLRAISDKDGNLFVVDASGYLTHTVFLKWLTLNNYIKIKSYTYLNSLSEIVSWQRKENTNDFYLSESYNMYNDYESPFFIANFADFIKSNIIKCKEKNPRFNFLPIQIMNNLSIDDAIAKANTTSITEGLIEYIPLLENSIADIKSFKPQLNGNNNSIKSYDIIKHFDLLYELEYKIHIINTSQYVGSPQRAENIKNIFEYKLREIIKELSKTFIIVFKYYISVHETMTMLELGDKSYGLKPALNEMWMSYKNVVPDTWDSIYFKFVEMLDEKVKSGEMPETKHFVDFLRTGHQDYLRDELFNYGVDRFNNELGKNFEDETQAQNWLNDYFEEEFSILSTITAESLEQLEEALLGYERFYGTRWKYVINEMANKIVYPIWYKTMAGTGFYGVMKNTKEYITKLGDISKLPLSEQSALLNECINHVHVGGDMMEYYESMFGVDKDTLEELSNKDTEDWDQEMALMGFHKVK